MDLEVIVSWDETIPYEKASLFHIAAIITTPPPKAFADKGFKPGYIGKLEGTNAVEKYVGDLLRDIDHGSADAALVSQSSGMKSFRATMREQRHMYLDQVLWHLKTLEKQHFIAPRNQWCTDQDYFTFFGSGNPAYFSSYTPGDHVELIRQTVYDMENGDTDVWKWTNVPKFSVGHNKESQAYVEMLIYERKHPGLMAVMMELEPVLDNISGIRSDEVERHIGLLNQVADALDRYKAENGVARIDRLTTEELMKELDRF